MLLKNIKREKLKMNRENIKKIFYELKKNYNNKMLYNRDLTFSNIYCKFIYLDEYVLNKKFYIVYDMHKFYKQNCGILSINILNLNNLYVFSNLRYFSVIYKI